MNLETKQLRSLGQKIILVGLLAFILWIPAMLVYSLVWERSSRADSVQRELIELAGGKQVISGPVLIAPATVDTGKTDREGVPISYTTTVVFTPKKLNISTTVETSLRNRSIYEATLFDAEIFMKGRFENLRPPTAKEGDIQIHWEQAFFAIKLASNQSLRGVRDTIDVKINGAQHLKEFEPGILLSRSMNAPGGATNYSSPGISTPLAVEDPDEGFEFAIRANLSGGGGLYFAPVGEDTTVSMKADWPDPSFQGGYLPASRQIDNAGFSADWRVPYLARNLPRSFISPDELAILDLEKNFGVEFIATASPYQSVSRALKYALMFLGLVFLTFFLFEVITGARAHAAQYILLGLTQVVFYVLVLAFSEHFGFATAFFITASATVCLSGYYAGTVFRSTKRGIIAFFAFSGAYGLIYLLMKSEDYALLIGSVTAFGALAITMFITRDLDWYGARSNETKEKA